MGWAGRLDFFYSRPWSMNTSTVGASYALHVEGAALVFRTLDRVFLGSLVCSQLRIIPCARPAEEVLFVQGHVQAAGACAGLDTFPLRACPCTCRFFSQQVQAMLPAP